MQCLDLETNTTFDPVRKVDSMHIQPQLSAGEKKHTKKSSLSIVHGIMQSPISALFAKN